MITESIILSMTTSMISICLQWSKKSLITSYWTLSIKFSVSSATANCFPYEKYQEIINSFQCCIELYLFFVTKYLFIPNKFRWNRNYLATQLKKRLCYLFSQSVAWHIFQRVFVFVFVSHSMQFTEFDINCQWRFCQNVKWYTHIHTHTHTRYRNSRVWRLFISKSCCFYLELTKRCESFENKQKIINFIGNNFFEVKIWRNSSNYHGKLE